MTYSGKRELLCIRRRQSLQPQMVVASKIGVAQSQYSNIENGYANPTAEQAAALIEMFGLPENYFEDCEAKNDGKEQNP